MRWPSERYLADENKAISSLPLAKEITIPDHLGQALAGSHKGDWIKACLAELDQMKQRDVWEVVDKTPSMTTIGHRWVFDIKHSINGMVEKFKAQMVARGDRQRPGVSSFDISGAYLYSPVEEIVLIEPSTTFLPHLKGKVLRLKKALYGMKQAGRCWWLFLSGILEHMGFAATEINQSLYIFCNDQEVITIWIHIDDGIVTSNSLGAISKFKMALCGELDIKWSDQLTHIMGLNCAFGEGEDALDPIAYQSVVGSLAYLVSGSRPDLAFAVNYLSRHSMKPTAEHWLLLDHVVGYLLKTHSHRIRLFLTSLALSLWSDAGWGGDLKHSQSGFILKLGDAPIHWSSKRQTVLALSTCAAEYVALLDSPIQFSVKIRRGYRFQSTITQGSA
ncbi:hypothetical protein O181_001087 [Austropuccinia psidii MF-1]|uniref:Reverse transcriptase Ty1/copia-type domain-containing protein n=1 Tax=Austropuccinia psidii MF-1 TaxID=1389203 RepID=A0A9Q3BA50_9BASI|nr:hypothetical protein [Austropuccinia psidii MF-1]